MSTVPEEESEAMAVPTVGDTPTAAPQHKRRQVAADLRRLVATLAPGDRLPSVSDLERHFGVAKNTVREAVQMLRDEGLVEARHGSGTFVAGGETLPPLAAAATGTLVALVPVPVPVLNAFFRHCVDELTAQAEKRGLKLVCRYVSGEATLADVVDLRALRPAGFLLFNYRVMAPVARALRQKGVTNVVVVGIPPIGEMPDVPCVYGDHEHGADLVAGRLLGLGHRRIAYVHEFATTDLRQLRRWHRHERVLREAGIAAEEGTIIGPERWGAWRDDPAAFRALLERPGAPTALAAWNDGVAVELLHLLGRAGLSVPGDVSLIGYDNLPVGAHSHPPLDTVDSHVTHQVRHALDLLSAPLEPGAAVPTVVVTPTPLYRQSGAPPAR